MSFIANRALPFDDSKYNKVVFEIYDLPESQVAWNLAAILANYKSVRFYVRKVGKPRFWKNIRTYSPFQIRNLKNSGQITMY